jgi:hypothetical protein
MLGMLHGVAGGWDELAIAVAALAVLWVAVKLAGRKSANDEDEDEDAEAAPALTESEAQDAAHSSPTPHT